MNRKSIAAIFARHVESEGQHKVSKGTADFPVDAKGAKEADSISSRIARLKPTAVISSPLERAIVPAQLTAKKSGVPLKIEPKLKPWEFGEWTGKPLEQVEPKLRAIWKHNPDAAPPGGTSLNQFARQSRQGILAALAQGGERPAIFTHSRNLRELPNALYGTKLADPTRGGPDPGEFDVLTTKGRLIRGK